MRDAFHSAKASSKEPDSSALPCGTGAPTPCPTAISVRFQALARRVLAAERVLRVTETADGGGRCLEYMALSPELEGRGGLYFNNTLEGLPLSPRHAFAEDPGSEESRSAAEAARLWDLSAALAGVAPDLPSLAPPPPSEPAAV